MDKYIAITILFIFTVTFLPITSSEDSLSVSNLKAKIPLDKGITLTLKAEPFDPKNHQIKTCKIMDWSGICLIDGKPVFGTDWSMPTTKLICATLSINNHNIDLDVSCMYNPWFGQPRVDSFSITHVEGGLLVRASFSDAAGSYDAEWFVVEHTAVRTLLSKKKC